MLTSVITTRANIIYVFVLGFLLGYGTKGITEAIKKVRG